MLHNVQCNVNFWMCCILSIMNHGRASHFIKNTHIWFVWIFLVIHFMLGSYKNYMFCILYGIPGIHNNTGCYTRFKYPWWQGYALLVTICIQTSGMEWYDCFYRVSYLYLITKIELSINFGTHCKMIFNVVDIIY